MNIKALTIILVISVLLIGWTEFEIFPYIHTPIDHAEKINSIITNFCLAYITSYAFYFVVVFLKENRDRENSRDYIYQNCQKVIGISDALNNKILEYTDGSTKSLLNIGQLNNILLKIPVDSEVKNHMRLYPFTWEKYIMELSDDTRYPIDRILGLLPYLDSALVKILNKIYDSTFLTMPKSIVSVSLIKGQWPGFPANMTMYSAWILEHFEHIEELRQYVKQNFKKNVENDKRMHSLSPKTE